VIALEPYGKGLLGTTLRYPYEVRDAKDYFGELPELALAPDMLALAAQILESKAADFDPNTFQDRYEEALLAHLKAKQAGTVQERKPTLPTPRRVIAMNVPMQVSISRSRTSMAPELDIVIRRLDAGDVLVVTRLDRAPVGLASRGASPPRLECISARPG
jgi:non-homologous end joining protein Ku